MTVQQLASKLKEFDECPEALQYAPLVGDEDYATRWFNETSDEFCSNASSELKKLTEEVLQLADKVLIINGNKDTRYNGSPNFEAHRALKVISGYRVGPGETDSFGWLSGIIYLNNFRIVYG